jgi:hypothetical protein
MVQNKQKNNHRTKIRDGVEKTLPPKIQNTRRAIAIAIAIIAIKNNIKLFIMIVIVIVIINSVFIVYHLFFFLYCFFMFSHTNIALIRSIISITLPHLSNIILETAIVNPLLVSLPSKAKHIQHLNNPPLPPPSYPLGLFYIHPHTRMY